MIFFNLFKGQTSQPVDLYVTEMSSGTRTQLVKVERASVLNMLWKRIKMEPKVLCSLKYPIRYLRTIWQQRLIPSLNKENWREYLKYVMKVIRAAFALWWYQRRELTRTCWQINYSA